MWTKVAQVLALGSTIAVSSSYAASGRPQGNEPLRIVPSSTVDRAAMIRQAKFWQAQGRDDLAIESLEKLLRVIPDDIGALADLALAQTRAGRTSQARDALRRLRQIDPGHSAFGKVIALERLEKADKNKLRHARMLAKAGRTEEALSAMRMLFPQGMPTPELELEYWQLVGAESSRWETAFAGLTALAQENPDHAKIQVALADHVLVRRPYDAQSLSALARLAKSPESEGAARSAWRRAMLRLQPTESNVSLVEQYLKQEKSEDSAVTDHLNRIRSSVETRRRLLADPRYQAKLKAMALFDSGKDEQAESHMASALLGQPDDADLLGALGVLRMRRGFHAEAHAYFLQASKASPENAVHWNGMARTARYWGLLKEVSDSLASNEPDIAENKLREAIALDPTSPDAWISAGKMYAAKKRLDLAEKAYKQALMRNASEFAAVRALVILYTQEGREHDADLVRRQARLNKQQSARLDDEVGEMRATQLQNEADLALKTGDTSAAVALLERAVQHAPLNPWVRRDLASLYASRGDAQAGDALFTDLLRRVPEDASARYAAALYQSSRGQGHVALVTLEAIASDERTDGMTRLQRRLWTASVSQNARRLYDAGERAAASQMLSELGKRIGEDHELALDVADTLIDVRDYESALALLARYAAQYRGNPDTGIRYARLLNRVDADEALNAQLTSLETARLTNEQKSELSALRNSMALRAISSLRSSSMLEEALNKLRSTMLSSGIDLRLNAAEAELLRALGKFDEAIDAYKRLLALKPDDPSATTNLIEVLIEHGQHGEALTLIGEAARLPNQNTDYTADLVASLIKLQRYETASDLNTAALTSQPLHVRSLVQASDLAQLRGDPDRAIDHLRTALTAQAAQRSSEDGVTLSTLAAITSSSHPIQLKVRPGGIHAALQSTSSSQYSRLAALLDTRGTWVVGAADIKSREGSPGKSSLHALEMPLEWRTSLPGDSRLAIRAETVRYDSGYLDPSDREFTSFGTAILCSNQCNGPLGQRASGVALSAAIDKGSFHADLGTTPIGFPINSIVGSVSKKGDFGAIGYTVEASRRAVTSSVLSYAGAYDPNTGNKWGGVTATGMRLGLSLDGGGLIGGWASLGRYRLAGTEVQTNFRSQAMAGITLRAVNEDDRLLSFGLTGMYWRHSHNAGEYTLGHGGYYSPESYRSMSVPITYAHRFGRLSFAVRSAISTSRSETAEAKYFPLDSTLQQRADEIASSNFSDAQYRRGSGGGHSHAVALAAEYQVTAKLFVGGRAQIDRSPDYAPNNVLLYFRYAVGRAAAKPVELLPQPIYPSSQN